MRKPRENAFLSDMIRTIDPCHKIRFEFCSVPFLSSGKVMNRSAGWEKGTDISNFISKLEAQK